MDLFSRQASGEIPGMRGGDNRHAIIIYMERIKSEEVGE